MASPIGPRQDLQHPIEKIDLPKASYIPPPESETSRVTYRLYKQGKTPVEIAAERKISLSTVMTHLEVYIANSEITFISKFVSPDKIAPIQAAFEKYGDAVLSPVMDALGKEKFSYDDLRMVRAWDYVKKVVPFSD